MIDFNKPLPDDASHFTDAEIRQLRDYVFERSLSDESWSNVEHRWKNPVERAWLLQTGRAMQSTRMKKK